MIQDSQLDSMDMKIWISNQFAVQGWPRGQSHEIVSLSIRNSFTWRSVNLWKGRQLRQSKEYECGVVCSLVQRKDNSLYNCSASRFFIFICDVTNESVCLTRRSAIADPYSYQCMTQLGFPSSCTEESAVPLKWITQSLSDWVRDNQSLSPLDSVTLLTLIPWSSKSFYCPLSLFVPQFVYCNSQPTV